MRGPTPSTKTKLGEYCRRMKGRLGKAEGITATAHKLARILYTLIASGASYDESQAFPVKPATQQKTASPASIPRQETRPPSPPQPRSDNKLVKRTGPTKFSANPSHPLTSSG